MRNDAELLQDYVATRDEAAFAELVRRHVNLVYRAALRQLGGDPHRAEDATQIVFTLLVRKAATLVRHPSLTGWLYSTTHFTVRDLLRAERRRQWREKEAGTMDELLSGKNEAVDWDRIRPVLDAVMQELAERDREAVLMRFFEGRAFVDVGRRFGLSEDAARMRIERALDKLRILLARRGVGSSAAVLAAFLQGEAALAAPVSLAATVTGAALAAPLAGAGPLWGLVHFMSTTKVMAAAGVCLLLASSLAVVEIRWRQAAEESLDRDRRELVALSGRLEESTRDIAQAEQALAARPRPAGADAAAPEPPAAEDEGRGPFGPYPPGTRARGRAMLAAYPEIKDLLIEEKRATFASIYHRLYRELGFTAEQATAFEDIMMAGVGSTWSSLPGGAITLEPAPALPPGEKAARLRDLLGEAGYRRLKDFDSTWDSRVHQVASALYFTTAPLTPEQGTRLQDVLNERNRTHRNDGPAAYWSAVRADAGTFLSAPQLEAFASLQAGEELNYARSENQRLRQPGNAAAK